MMSLDEFLPEFDAIERHHIMIQASTERVYRSLLDIDLNQSRLIRYLFLLRGLQRIAQPTGDDNVKRIRMADFSRVGFVVLAEKSPVVFILGLIGRFWTLNGGLLKFRESEFSTFQPAGYAKAVWGFDLKLVSRGHTKLTTETRVQVVNRRSRLLFGLYWLIIGPFSGLIRRQILLLVKNHAESPNAV